MELVFDEHIHENLSHTALHTLQHTNLHSYMVTSTLNHYTWNYFVTGVVVFQLKEAVSFGEIVHSIHNCHWSNYKLSDLCRKCSVTSSTTK